MRSARKIICLAVVAAAAAVPSGAAASSASGSTAGQRALPAADHAIPAKGPGVAPTPAEAAQIIQAVHASPLAAGLPPKDYTVADIRLSASTPGWAYAQVVPTPSAEMDKAVVVLSRKGTTWRLGEIGTAFVGCSTAPADVLLEFKITCE